jgi:hypothetical protein
MTGYNGRVGIYEIMPMSQELKKVVAAGTELSKLRDLAMREGMKPCASPGQKRSPPARRPSPRSSRWRHRCSMRTEKRMPDYV